MNQQGFGLIQVLIFIAVFSIVGASLMSMTTSQSFRAARIEEKQRVEDLQSRMEMIFGSPNACCPLALKELNDLSFQTGNLPKTIKIGKVFEGCPGSPAEASVDILKEYLSKSFQGGEASLKDLEKPDPTGRPDKLNAILEIKVKLARGDYKSVEIPLSVQVTLDPKQSEARVGWISSCSFSPN